MMQRIVVFMTLAATLGGCATASLSRAGASVLPIQSTPAGNCSALGTVVGEGGGAFGGAYISNADLIEYAMNDARNKAAELGASHVQLGAPALGVAGSNGSTTTTTATVIGTAYRCSIAPVAQPAAAPIAQPAAAAVEEPAAQPVAPSDAAAANE